ncbi:cation-translocating P-type ATPase [Conexibacter sp. JD483]|uniref:heavy metal translocating P-type ATPase n=1 Tax=unclassified Conexibacter TaxID=2627773 RepID=UPI0027281ED2|nr:MULTISPECIES: cation-translocating P-type ATPase [unclassified Conexibacter]MDO8188124.1 cation-translocating P-type ATPase [Conexibacter sp. CPCC 205706]MDO8201312.1 cation-translocating P-type ATPase [Conexibacter sp. CPCC 205762]MDR9370417.1 cation-translocating P-type ATPase [Conexibacter sp. JD483]
MSSATHSEQTTIEVGGMDCAGCARTVSQAVARMPAVIDVDVSFTAGRMVVEHAPEGFDRAAVARQVQRLGYTTRVAGEAGGAAGAGSAHDAAAPAADRRALLRWPSADLLTIVATALLLVAVVADLATGLPAAWLYGAAVAVGIGPIARAGLVALWSTRRPEIKLLMTIASIGAIAIGAWMEAALVVVLFSIGEWLEGRAVERARRELASLVTLAPETARIRVRDDGAAAEREISAGVRDGDAAPAAEREIPAAALELGDVVVVRPGERLPADGTVLEGTSAVDQAAITGESVPVDVEPGARVFAGTLNAQGRLVIEVGAAPGDTTLARIGQLVADAQARRSPSERWVDAFARIYTPAVIAAAVLVAAVPPLAWGAGFDGSFYTALALLILACPCALVLSTPVTIVSALGRASAAGVLVKGGEFLERAAAIDTVAFDKTGTLTAGRPRLVTIDALGGDEDRALRLAAALEAGSEHPLATAIVAAARERGLPISAVEQFQARTGLGATGVVDGALVAIGKPALFSAATASSAVGAPAQRDLAATSPAIGASADVSTLMPAVERALAAAREAGQTAVVLARDGEPLAVLGLADPPRPEAREAVEQLARLGITKTVMITGDNAAAAQAVAAATGVAELRADALPQDKARLLGGLGDHVAMVGDGVNDAPALASASLGIAMGSAGSDTAIEVADVALMGDDPRKVAGLVGLARWTRRTVRQNIAFSLATKVAAAVLLAFGLLPLWAAVATDVGASLVVVLWGLRLLVASPRGLPLLNGVQSAR